MTKKQKDYLAAQLGQILTRMERDEERIDRIGGEEITAESERKLARAERRIYENSGKLDGIALVLRTLGLSYRYHCEEDGSEYYTIESITQ